MSLCVTVFTTVRKNTTLEIFARQLQTVKYAKVKRRILARWTTKQICMYYSSVFAKTRKRHRIRTVFNNCWYVTGRDYRRIVGVIGTTNVFDPMFYPRVFESARLIHVSRTFWEDIRFPERVLLRSRFDDDESIDTRGGYRRNGNVTADLRAHTRS